MRRLGCFGCLTSLVFVALVGGIAWAGFRIVRAPDFIAPPTAKADGIRAQQKIFELFRRGGGGRARSMTLSEREVNAFLSRHLGETPGHAAPEPGRPPDRRRDGGKSAGQIPVRELLDMSRRCPRSPATFRRGWLDHSIWLSLRTRVTLEGRNGARERRHLRLDVERFWLGRLRLPEVMLRVLLEPETLRLLRWSVPNTIEGLRIEPGRLILQSAP